MVTPNKDAISRPVVNAESVAPVPIGAIDSPMAMMMNNP